MILENKMNMQRFNPLWNNLERSLPLSESRAMRSANAKKAAQTRGRSRRGGNAPRVHV